MNIKKNVSGNEFRKDYYYFAKTTYPCFQK